MPPPDHSERATEAKIAALGLRMGRAVAAQDFEEAARLRRQIDRLAGVDPDSAHGPALGRGRPGGMGLGTDQVSMRARPGWKPPPKPDPMTSNTKPAHHKRKGE